MSLDYLSDYGSASSSNSSTTWVNQEKWPQFHPRLQDSDRQGQRSASYLDLVTGKCTLDDVMKEFKMNGSDSPYDPDEENIWKARPDEMIGLGPSSAYLRQKSWPEPERTPAQRLPKPAAAPEWAPAPLATSTPINDEEPGVLNEPVAITLEQSRVLSSLPDGALYALLRRLQRERERADCRADCRPPAPPAPHECRFCKNNGERESYYRSHALKDPRGRVACPVLRAFVCKRCGASGDAAHTIKYCPFSTNEERLKSTAMMRSVRMASGRRRLNSLTPSVSGGEHYVVFGETTPSATYDNNVHNAYGSEPLDPLWAALEQKLMF